MFHIYYFIIFVFMISSRFWLVSSFFTRLNLTPFYKQLTFIPTKKTNFDTLKSSFSALKSMPNSENPEELTVFHKIVKGELPCKKVYEDDLVLAFYDIQPASPSHILIIPKEMDGLASLSDATERHEKVLGHMLVKAAHIAKENNLGDFRVVINSGPGALQTVFYLHMHLMSGRRFNWPPG
ncbi:14 kDa zinc-binding protein [Theileria parva strain Muguga]|uniref:Protein kinase C interacting protein 1, putative n=1 Tax=Theileria parva TaxID=5875 RepID=Q4N9V7_THEPA|nr:14 kDa zinc-binding protein [Theileria parva strain Muguga]EAN33256.1 14 kDa zinc-binding protein [Theileria parva strain Muguga]|eukprot:XP_765539.1 protein kinase C interacting protein 1 [Theileria parva strain Muguga]